MPILIMVDSTSPILSPPSGSTVAAGYLIGHGQTRHWTAGDWNAAAAIYAGIVPIYVSLTFDTPEADAESTIAQWKGFGFPVAGVAFVLDIEQRVAEQAKAANYPRKWCARIRDHGGVPVDYTSKSTMPIVDQDQSPDWTAYYNGLGSLDGHAGHQYADPGPWDLSVIDPVRIPPYWPRGVPTDVAAGTASPSQRGVSPRTFVGLMADPHGRGYWQLRGDGGVFTFPVGGSLPFFGSMGSSMLARPARCGAVMPDGSGYLLVAEDGGVFTFGSTPYFGSMANQSLNRAVVSVALTPTGRGYWLLGADGGVFSFGDAAFLGRPSSTASCVAILADPKGRGYWVVAADGGVFTFGAGVPFAGSMGDQHLNAPIVAAAATHDGAGYLLAAADGGVFTFGSAAFMGSRTPHMVTTVSAIAVTPTDQGYWLQRSDDGHIVTFGDAEFSGRTPV